MPTRFRTRVGVAVTVILLTGALTACSPTQPEATEPLATPSATPTATPTFNPDAPADEAILFFDSVNTATLTNNESADGRAFIDGLVAAGFDKATMEVTADSTTIGNAADSVQFSVRWGESCLIGQNGTAVDGYHSTVGPLLGTGTCLIGTTRPIDW